MFVALSDSGERVHAWDASQAMHCVCPECRTSVVWKHGRIVVPHFAHRPESGCAYGVGESERHHEMKWQVGQLFDSWFVQYEVPFAPERRADLVVFETWVIECQASPLSVAEWEARTAFYNRIGSPVLWVWDWDRLREVDPDEFRIPAEIRYCHQKNYGTVYVLDNNGELTAAHFASVSRTRVNDYQGVRYDYTLKTTKHIQMTPIDSIDGRITQGPDGHTLVNFVRGGWWKR
jgi:competence CoiA-like predicted nuclease